MILADADLAAQLAEAAGRILLNIRAQPGLKGRALGQAGDAAANSFLMEALKRERPADAVLSEETEDDPARLASRRVWIIDPLDGTREYGEGRVDWAVHVALAIDGVAAIGAVALPSDGLVMRSDQPVPLPAAATPPRLVVSRTRPCVQASAVAAALGAVLVPMGSAGAKAMAIVRGEADIYVHAGGQHQWDNCAPVAVARAYGLHCSRLDGSALVYNQPGTSLPDLIICRPAYVAAVMQALA